MSLWRDELKPAQTTVGCLIALAIIAVASLGRVIEGPGYLGWAIAALGIGSGFALWFGQRSLGAGFVLLFIAGTATLPMLFVRDPEVSRLPTPSAFAAIRNLIAEGFAGIGTSTPPAPSEPRFVILLWIALLLLGFLGAAWVVVRRPIGAVISAIAVVTFSGSVGDGPGRNAYALAAIAATGAFFLAEGRHRIARWGGGRISIPGWLGVPTLALGCAVALGAPYVLGETPIVKLNSAIRPRVVIIKPLSDIRRQLKVDPPLEVLRVTSPQASYWRLTGLDAYDGREWVLEARPRDLRQGRVPPADPPPSGELLEQRYRLTSLLAPWLPAAYAARTVDASQTVQVDGGSATLLLRDDSRPGLTYTVVSRQPRVTANVPAPPKDTADDNARAFEDAARPIVEGARTPLDTARRLEAHFRTYTYSEDVAAGHTVARLQQFLRERAGYCEQFAAAMTLMLRSLGIEARVGVGFLPGTVSGGEYVVSTRDAHAWVEANIPGAGWVQFDPTPGRGNASNVPPDAEEQPAETEEVPQPTAVPDPTPVPQDFPEEVQDTEAGFRIPAQVLWTILAIAVVASVPSAKAIRRGRRRRGPPQSAVAGAFSELVDRARDLGWRPAPSETPREFVSRALAGSERATDLAVLTSRALYGPHAVERRDADEAWTLARSAHRAVAQASPLWRRIVAIFDPRTLLPDRPWRRARLRVATALGRG